MNYPIRVGNVWYLEYQTTATLNGAKPLCTQWRFDATAKTLSSRTWTVTGGAVTPTPFKVQATPMTNNPTTQQPFTMLPADSTFSKQRVLVLLQIQTPDGIGSQLASTFVARNTSTGSVTNTDTNSDGVSDTQVCQEAGRP